MTTFNVNPFARYDFVNPMNPSILVNPKVPYASWLNTTTGEEFVCLQAITGDNIWIGSHGTIIDVRTADPFFPDVSILLPMFGEDQSLLFKERSPNGGIVLQRNGDVKIVTSLSKYYGGSGYFDGTGDYINTVSGAVLDLTGDFTFEAWIHPIALTTDRGILTLGAVSADSNRIQLYLTAAGSLAMFGQSGTTNRFWPISAAGLVEIGNWYHVAGVLEGTSARIYINGTQVASDTASGGIVPTETLNIGVTRTGNTYRYFSGNMQDVRVTKGVARYSGAFTPPSQFTAGL